MSGGADAAPTRKLLWECRRPSTTGQVDEERDHGQHEKHEEQDLRDTRGQARQASEPKQCSDDRDDQKNYCVTNHEIFPFACAQSCAVACFCPSQMSCHSESRNGRSSCPPLCPQSAPLETHRHTRGSQVSGDSVMTTEHEGPHS